MLYRKERKKKKLMKAAMEQDAEVLELKNATMRGPRTKKAIVTRASAASEVQLDKK